MVIAYIPSQGKGGTQQVNRPKVVGKVGKFNICFRPEQLTSHAGTALLQDFAQRLGVEGVLDEELRVEVSPGLWLTAAGGVLLVVGGALSVAWSGRGASAPADASVD